EAEDRAVIADAEVLLHHVLDDRPEPDELAEIVDAAAQPSGRRVGGPGRREELGVRRRGAGPSIHDFPSSLIGTAWAVAAGRPRPRIPTIGPPRPAIRPAAGPAPILPSKWVRGLTPQVRGLLPLSAIQRGTDLRPIPSGRGSYIPLPITGSPTR